jgi:hypothetical protein
MGWIDGFFENRSWTGLVQKNSVSGALEVAGVALEGIPSFTWAAKPVATEVAIGSYIRIPASEFTHTSIPLIGMILQTDGAKWIPAFGGQILAEEWGSLAVPLVSHDTDAEALFTLPGGTPNAPEGLILPGIGIEILAVFRDTGTHSAGGAINARMGTSATLLSNTVVGFAAGAAGTSWDVRISTELRIPTSTKLIYDNFTSTNGSAAATRVYDVTGTYGSAYAQKFSFSRAHSGAADSTALTGYRIRLVS